MAPMRKILLVGLAAGGIAVGVTGAATHTSAAGSHGTFQFLIGTGGTSEPFGPEISRDPTTGDILQIVGMGTFTQGVESSATGGGTFVHTDDAGHLLAQGTWTVDGVDFFDSYGNAPPFPPSFGGGLAHLDVTFHPVGTTVTPVADLEIDCAINSPHPNPLEGVKVRLNKGPQFTVEIFGENLFIHQS